MISKRLKNLKPSPTLKLAELSRNLKASGKDVISLSVGEPDWSTPDHISKALFDAVSSGFTKYVPSSGILDLKQAICEDTNSYLGTDYEEKNVSVTTGAKIFYFFCITISFRRR